MSKKRVYYTHHEMMIIAVFSLLYVILLHISYFSGLDGRTMYTGGSLLQLYFGGIFIEDSTVIFRVILYIIPYIFLMAFFGKRYISEFKENASLIVIRTKSRRENFTRVVIRNAIINILYLGFCILCFFMIENKRIFVNVLGIKESLIILFLFYMRNFIFLFIFQIVWMYCSNIVSYFVPIVLYTFPVLYVGSLYNQNSDMLVNQKYNLCIRAIYNYHHDFVLQNHAGDVVIEYKQMLSMNMKVSILVLIMIVVALGMVGYRKIREYEIM